MEKEILNNRLPISSRLIVVPIQKMIFLSTNLFVHLKGKFSTSIQTSNLSAILIVETKYNMSSSIVFTTLVE